MAKYRKPLTLRMDADLHTELKIAAARERTTIHALMEAFTRVGLRHLEDSPSRRAEIDMYAREVA